MGSQNNCPPANCSSQKSRNCPQSSSLVSNVSLAPKEIHNLTLRPLPPSSACPSCQPGSQIIAVTSELVSLPLSPCSTPPSIHYSQSSLCEIVKTQSQSFFLHLNPSMAPQFTQHEHQCAHWIYNVPWALSHLPLASPPPCSLSSSQSSLLALPTRHQASGLKSTLGLCPCCSLSLQCFSSRMHMLVASSPPYQLLHNAFPDHPFSKLQSPTTSIPSS